MKKNKQSGFSLIEVLIFITILSLFFVTAISVSAYTMRNIRLAQQRIYATQYANEMREWLIAEKEESWNSFFNNAYSIYNQGDTCALFDDQEISWTDPAPVINCTKPAVKPLPKLDNTFLRKVTFSEVSTSRIVVTISVEWTDRQKYTVPVTTVFTPQ